jgi:hypothetical protein
MGRKVGGANRKSGSIANKNNPSLNSNESDELTYNIKIDNEEVEDIVEDF